MHFLVIDVRYGTPIYVFLERDPHGQDGYPDLIVQEVSLEAGVEPGSVGRRAAIGRDPAHLEQFREFISDGAVARAGLGEESFAAAWAEGRAMAPSEAMALALEC